MESESSTWRNKLELIAKIVTAVGALFAGIFIPIVINYNQEKNRETQLYVQIMTQREQSDSTLRAQMFNSLISSYFGQDMKTDPAKQMMYLNLLTLNFQEFFDARPLFEDLGKKLTGNDLADLIAIARNAADRQVNLLSKPESIPVTITLCMIEEDDCSKMDNFTLNGKKKRLFPFNVVLRGVDSLAARLRVSSADDSFNFKTIEFEVSYFDTPFMDNTKLIDGSRFAFLLRNVDPVRQKATLEVIAFPQEYMNLRDRPYFDEMLWRLGDKNNE